MPVSLRGWISEFRENYRENPSRALMQALWCTYLGPWFTLTSRYPFGTNVYDREWDALVILDACRVDALRAVADEYDFLDESRIGSILSVGSGSYEWLVKTFTTDYLSDVRETALVTANGFDRGAFLRQRYAPSVSLPFGWPRDNVVVAEDFKEYVPAWRHGHDDQLGNVPPRYLTDRAIGTARRVDAERYLFHYAQPHTPYMSRAARTGEKLMPVETKPWPALRRGDLSRAEAWDMYLDNLRYVLDDVELLFENLDAERVIISADHGEAFGECRIHGHPTGVPLSVVKRVPWAVTTAADEETYTPEASTERDDEGDPIAAEEHLEALGYR
ncbi:hypothetical protein [Haladaptatus sp. NG-WS-4]